MLNVFNDGNFFDRLNYFSIKSSHKNLQKNATWLKKFESIKKNGIELV
jgi:hypothetical protein